MPMTPDFYSIVAALLALILLVDVSILPPSMCGALE